ncbi:MAG: radical SAM protein [Clostridia bacterium]|jgi:radical SAM superfamily enzyme YgiQ (UPF0313 family)|nr:radical SAM protein [Clostridia bacterium]
MNTFSIGHIRPPFHANSLLLRVTENCTWNKCNFCTLYKEGTFHTRKIDDIKKDIDTVVDYRDMIISHINNGFVNQKDIYIEYTALSTDAERECYSMVFNWITADNMKSVFLQDANTMALLPEKTAEIISYLCKKLPEISLVAIYGRADTLSKITPSQYDMLKKSGLTMIHSGFESGCDYVLKLLNKGITSEQQIKAGKMIKKAGITFNAFYMNGSGGRSLSEKNAIETAEVMNKINPDYIRIRTFVVKPNTVMWHMSKDGRFDECTDIEKVKELFLMIQNLKNCDGYIISDHIINLLPFVEGHIKDKDKIEKYIENFLEMPRLSQKRYQIARRVFFGGDYENITRFTNTTESKIDEILSHFTNESDFEDFIRSCLRRYI